MSGRANQVAHAAILLVGLVFLAGGLNSAVRRYRTEVAVERPPLFGIWTVEDFSLDGEARPPLVTDHLRWRLVVFENIHPFIRRDATFQRGKFARAEEMHVYGMDDAPKEWDLYGAETPSKGGLVIVNTSAGTLELYANSMDKFSPLSFTQAASDQLEIAGVVNGHKIRSRMKLFNASNFYLVSHANELKWIGSGSYR